MHSSKPTFLHHVVAVASLCALLIVGIAFPQQVVFAAGVPVPAAILSVPTSGFIGEPMTFTVAFDNTSAADTGYGPYVNLELPAAGADGAGGAVDDGITFNSASYLGTPLTPVIAPFICNGSYVHPLTKLTTTCTLYTQVVILQPPYGSFTATQPPAVLTITTAVSNLADQNTALTIAAQAGFFLGNDALDNPGTDPAIVGTTTSTTYTPILFKLKKTYIGPEDETATGPNFVRQYRVAVDVANGQTISNLDLIDLLPNTMQFTTTTTVVVTASVGTPTVSAIATPSTTTPGGTLTRRLSSVVGTLGAEDAVMQFSFYVPRLNASNAVIIDPLTGDDVVSLNNASTSGAWSPIDIRDTPIPQTVSINPVGPEHTLTDKSIAIQKHVADVTDSNVSPGDVLEYTLDVQVSDFFALNGIVISDTFSDGQHFDPTFTPRMQVNGNPFTLAAANMGSANYVVGQNFTGATATPPIFTLDPTIGIGKTRVIFQVSNELITRGQNGRLVGGCVSPTGAGLVPCLGDGPTTLQITFRTVIQDQFTDDYPSGEKNVDEGDKLTNAVIVSGRVLNNVGLTSTGNFEDDDSAASVEIARGDLKKTVYAINGNTSCPPSNNCANAVIAPGDQVTYRIELTVPSSDIEGLELIDYLPLPIFSVDDIAAPYISRITSFAPVVDAATPAAGTAKFGPTDTFFTRFGKNPFNAATANDSVANSVTFDYGSFNDPTNQPSKIDLLFTVTASNRPFADLLLLTNQVRKQESSTNNGPYITDAIVQVKVNEPDLNIRKGIVAASNPAAVFAPTTKLPAGVTMNMAAASCAVRQTGTVISSTLTGTFNSDVSNVDANDQLMYAIVVENTGSGPDGAFDVMVKDVLPSNVTLVPGSVCATDGTGAAFTTSGDLFSTGLELADPGPTTTPIGGIDSGKSRLNTNPSTTGRNIAIITYLATISTSVTPGQTLVNTATLFNFGSSEGGPDFTLLDKSDPAQATIPTPTPSKLLVATSESSTSDAASPPRVTIGEVVRYRLAVRIPEGTSGANLQFRDILPIGLTFLNDNTAKVAFVSNGGLSSSTLSGVPNYVATGVALTDVPSSSVTGGLPDAAVSSSVGSNTDIYNSGTDPYFSLGTLTNADNDDNAEYVIVDFNALVDNSTAANTAGAQLDNAVRVLINGVQVGANSTPTTVRIAEPSLTLTKAIVTPASAQGDAGDTVTYRLTYTNATGADVSTAFETLVSDTLPNTLVLNTANITTTVNGGAAGITNSSAGNTVSVTIASIPPGGSVQVDYTAQIKTTVSSGQQIQNTANLVYTSLPGANGTTSNPTGSATPGTPGNITGERTGTGGINKYNTTTNATLTVFLPTPVKTLVTTSEAHTTGSNVAIGEVVRYRVEVRVAEGSSTNFQLRDNLPAGMTFLNDGTAKLALASTDPGLSSSTLSGLGLQVSPKDETNVGTVVPTFVIPTGAITGGTGPGGAFGDGDDPIFSLGNLANIDSDADQEFVVVEFNALTGNVATNIAGTTLNNTATARINGSDLATSGLVPVIVNQPQITLAKTVKVTPPVKVGDTVTYTIIAANSGATAFETHVLDTLDSNLTLVAATVITKPAYATVTNNTAAPTADLTIDELRTGDSVMIQITATINAVSATGQTTPNTASVTYTSLPGTNGTTTNATGSATPGAAGSGTGERTGTGGVNSFTTSSSAPLALGSIGDTVWYDADGNGVLNGVEKGLSGVTVNLTLPGTNGTLGDGDDVTVSTTTDASGQYRFTGLPAATYRVTVDTATLPAGFSAATYDLDGTGTASTAIATLTAAQNRTDADFGYRGTGSIGDFVWFDTDGDGVQDAGEPGLANVTMTLTWAGQDGVQGNADDISFTQDTNASGGYNFTNLPAGKYSVDIDQTDVPAGTTLTAGSDPLNLTLTAGQVVTTADFGFTGTGSLGDRVWLDSNSNGVQNPGESGLVGVGVSVIWAGPNGTLGNADDITYPATTGANGIYSVTKLPAGPYRVNITTATLPAGVTTTYDLDGTGTASTTTTSLTSGQNRTDVDFGYVGSASIGDFVWLDKDGDTVQDAGEPGLANVTITLTWFGQDGIQGNADDLTFTLDTNVSGGYNFTNLPAGKYIVDVDQTDAPAGTTLTTGNDPLNLTLTAGQAYTTADFGFTGSAALGDRVWLDRDNDGVQDAGEPGLVGVGVNLVWYGKDGLVGGGDDVTYTTTTGTNGAYNFTNLPAGTFAVTIVTATLPTGVTATYDLDGTATASAAAATLTNGQIRTDVDFGYVGSASIGDFVWLDKDGDTVQDAGEPGLANVTITLTWFGQDGVQGNADDLTFTQDTNASGGYSFTNLPAGKYVVDVDQADAPAGTTLTTGNDLLNVTLTTGQAVTTVDFGFTGSGSIGDRVWLDLDNDGTQDAGEPGLEGTGVDVVWGGPDNTLGNTDDVTYTVTTAANGIYGVNNLPAGPYRVTINTATLPAGVTASYDLDGIATASKTITALTNGQARTDVDFGYAGSGALGDRVWFDTNGNGTQDVGEPGLVGVGVNLLWYGKNGVTGGSDDVTYATTTGANGAYTFTNLPAGAFKIDIDTATLPTGVTTTYDLDGFATASTTAAALTNGQIRTDADFGYTGSGTIGDFVWLDKDGDGVQDAGEPGLANVTVTLTWAGKDTIPGNADDLTFTKTTNTSGGYSFTNLPAGSYSVNVDTTTTPAGTSLTTSANPISVTLTTGQTDTTADFGFTGSADLGDRVWLDLNGDGVQDAGEPGLVGVGVDVVWAGSDGTLGTADDVTYPTTTGANGIYGVDKLPAGPYRADIITATLPTGVTASYDLNGGNDSTTTTALTTGQSRSDVDFGYVGSGSIGDFVWLDKDGDGVQDAGEPGLANIAVTLTWFGQDGIQGNADDATLTQTTDATGGYSFTGLPAGSYSVTVDAKSAPIGTALTTGNNPLAITLTTGQTYATADFGFTGSATLGDRVWNDANNNGQQDNSEVGLTGVSITLTWAGADDIFGTTDDTNYPTTTGVNGIYGFSKLPAGTYRVDVDTATLPAGLNPSYDLDGTATASTVTTTLTTGQSRTDVDFGYSDLAPPATGLIGDRVWRDTDGNGVQDAGEPGIANVTIHLTGAGADGIFGTADDVTNIPAQTTDADGLYAFGNLVPGSYRVTLDSSTLPAGLGGSYESDGTLNGSTDVALAAGAMRRDVDFGFTPASAGAPTGSIGDRVWNDTDGNGVQDAGENGIAGVKLTLTWAGPDGIFGNADDTTGTTTTGTNGSYSFTALPTGQFRVTLDSITLPAGLNATYELDGSRDGQVTLALTSGQDRSDVDFGYTSSPVTVPTGSIGDRVWLDTNGNGIQDAGEPGLAGITINITWYGADGVLGGGDDLAYVATTGANGSYNLPNLPAGSYNVSIDPTTLPVGVVPAFDLDGGTDGTTTVTLAAGQQRTDVDFGYTGTGSIGDRVWNDANANRIQDNSETGISGVDVTLLWAGADGVFGTADDVTRTTTTGIDGIYTFTGLPAGTYHVAVSGAPLAGLNETYELDGSTDATTTVALTVGQSRTDADFGYTSLALGALGSLGDRVWLDLDGNGAQNGSEPGLAGVTVNLLSAGVDGTFETADDVTYSQPTDANGAYSFSGLPAGQYRVNIDTGALPAGLDATFDLDGGNDSTADLALTAGQNRTDADFGYRGSAMLGDRVWDDLNGDGVQDAGEAGMNGVTVQLTWTGPDGLLGTADDVTFTTTTAGDGNYSFGNLPAGTYRVAIDPTTLPAGMLATYDLDGSLDNIASVGLTIGQQRDDVDFGSVVPVIDLQLIKTANGTATAGSTVVYTLAYTNAGNFDTDGVVINETVPAHTTFNAAASTAGWSCAGTTPGSACTFAVGALPRLGHGQVQFAVTLPNPVPAGVNTITNTASIVDNAAHGADASPPNNTAGVTTLVDAAPDLQLQKSDGGNLVRAGRPITYTLSYTNVGTQDATGVVITETVSAHTTFSAAASQQGWTCNGTGAGSICTFAIGNLPAGQSGSVRFVTVVESPIVGGAAAIVNTASIGDNGANGADPTGPGNRLNNNLAGVTTTLAPTAITLTRFTATRASTGVVVRWTTTAEQDTFGFRLYRSNDNDRSHAALVTPTFILGQGRDGGASYSWTDSSAQAGTTYSYWLEEVDLNNQSAFYGPVRVSEQLSSTIYQVLLPIVKR